MVTLNELTEMKQLLDEKTRERDKISAQITYLKEQLNEKFDVGSLEEAKELLEQLTEEQENILKEITPQVEELKKEIENERLI
jgi:hypothetical protein